MIQMSMNQAEKLLPSNYFCRINKSHIVSLFNSTDFDSDTVYVGDVQILLGRNYKKKFMERIIILDKIMITEQDISNKNDGLLRKIT